MRGSGRSVGGQGVVIGDHLEVRCSLPKEMDISRSEIFRKQEHKVSYRCSLPSPLQKRSKNYKELYWRFVLLSFLWLWQKVWFVLVSAGVNLGGVLAQVWEPGYFEHGGHARARGEYEFMWGTKPKEIHFSSNQCNSNFLPKSKKTLKLKTSMQSFVILGSLLQWRWQWASIGHFVFLFLNLPLP